MVSSVRLITTPTVLSVDLMRSQVFTGYSKYRILHESSFHINCY